MWAAAAASPAFPHGICGSLTVDCSEERIRDAYELAQTYRDILARVTAEYAELTSGDSSAVIIIGGESVGGALKAAGATLTFSEASWVYKFSSDQLSCCDCFHTSIPGQDSLARGLFNGFTCSPTDVCCAYTGDALADGLCATEDTSGRFVSGL